MYDDYDEDEQSIHHGASALAWRRTEMLRDRVRERKERGVQMVGKFASVLTSREVKARLVSGSGSPAVAWSTSNTIGFDDDKLKDIGTIEGLLAFKGLSVHEVCHILFSPRSGSDIAQWVRDNNMNDAYQALEDQRIETLMVGRFGGSVVPWLTSAIAGYLLDNPNGMPQAYALVRGRRYLPVEVRAMVRDAYENQQDLDELSAVIDEYRLLLFPADTDRAKELIEQMDKLLGNLSQKPQSSCGQKDADTFESSGDSRPLSLRQQRDARNNAQNRKGEGDDKQQSQKRQQQQQGGGSNQSKSGKDQSDKSNQKQGDQSNGGQSDKDQNQQGDGQDQQDGSGNGDQQDGQDQNGAGNGDQDGQDQGDQQGDGDGSDSGDGDQDGQGGSSGSGSGSGNDSDQQSGNDGGNSANDGQGAPNAGSGESDQQAEQNPAPQPPSQQELSDALKDAVNQAKDKLKDSLDRDMREVNGDLELMSNDAAEPKKSDWSLVPADAITTRATKAFGRELERLKADNEPGWERVTPSGRINPSRYLRGAELDEAFDRWTLGREDATDIEAVMLLDVSSSMSYNGRAENASNATWGIKRALDRINARCTVITYNGGAPQMLYKPMEAASTQVKRVHPSGGTDPTLSIKYATRVLAESDRAIKILFSVTDGEWGGVEQADQQIKMLRQAGVLTAIAMINEGDTDLRNISSHNHEVVAQIKTSADLFVLGRHLVRVATERNLT